MNTDRDHLDAETVAAWMDGGLDKASLAAAEAHASNCERCQALLATVVKTEPAAALGTRHQAPGTTSIWKWWMAPIAATAAAVTLWMVVPQEQLQQTATSAPTIERAPAEPARDEATPAAPPAPAPATPGARRNARDDQSVEAKRTADVELRQAQKPQAPREQLGAAAGNLADATAGKARTEARTEARFERAETPPPARAPAAAPAAAAPAEAALQEGAKVAQLRKQAAPLVVVSPAPRFRWRVSVEGIEFSQDGGRTWLPVRLPQGEVITAGSAPAPLVCWLVGRRGVVLVATDGTNFTRIPFPEPVDLTAVSSSELRMVTVTTADGRVFRTENAGRTWQRQ